LHIHAAALVNQEGWKRTWYSEILYNGIKPAHFERTGCYVLGIKRNLYATEYCPILKVEEEQLPKPMCIFTSGFCDHGNERLVPIKGEEFLDEMVVTFFDQRLCKYYIKR
jgi:hypothetical protein